MVTTRRQAEADAPGMRNRLLDCAQQLMIESGYAAVTYRKVAAKAGVTGGSVQYYFPTLDDLLIAGIERATDHNVARLTAAIEARPDEPLRVIWEFTKDEAAAAVMLEYIALGNHRKSIRNAIAAATKRIRDTQHAALAQHWERRPGDEPSPAAVLFLMNGLSKMAQLEAGFGIEDAHAEVMAMMDRFIESRS
jgi:TetR/AcrR family transcriptional repressor of nem operon